MDLPLAASMPRSPASRRRPRARACVRARMGLLHSLRFEPAQARLKVTKMVAVSGTLETLAGSGAVPRRAIPGFSRRRRALPPERRYGTVTRLMCLSGDEREDANG